MKKALIMVLTTFGLAINAKAQKPLSGKEIYLANCKSVVQIISDGKMFGNGFIVSPDGVIVTANHVVTTAESGFRQYAADIKVLVDGAAGPYQATPVVPQVTDDQRNFDSALIKISASQLPHVTLGKWDEVDIGDHVVIIPSYPGWGCIALEGAAAKRAEAANNLGPRPVKTILFQVPVRNGFSGSPIFSSQGHVIGIVDTKVFGISESLGELRQKWTATSTRGSVAIMGIDLSASFLDLINNLDQNLISGLGTGVAIEYAKKQEEATKVPAAQH